jgi:hypothetical protein
MTTPQQGNRASTRGAPSLVAILLAARATNDRDLERAAKTELETQHGIRISFRREAQHAR